ncbi:hypothetical protein [Pseudomonas caspiana]|uniref:Uncharacterized protein n=1 Tax=Pseudomonas caspiana TaxID=1451454 RepID=A0A1Y3P3U2_9PSED|nr:hypothetical protein [Pseudomonas caspiana]OUM74468.1 hypothetical protein AUC60_06880 [Pseudomonas caspiana]
MTKIKKKNSEQLPDFVEKAKGFSIAHGDELLNQFEMESKLLLEWIKYLNVHHLTGIADELLTATLSNIREAAAYAAIGAVRPCLFALRAQPDLLLSWLYFKDHAVEYASLCRTGDYYVLKTEVLKYFASHYEGFSARLVVMNQTMTRTQLDPYRLLSAHIHSQSPFVINHVVDLQDIIKDQKLAAECAVVQREVSEFLSDILFSLGFASYHSLPNFIRRNVEARTKTEGQKKVVFA